MARFGNTWRMICLTCLLFLLVNTVRGNEQQETEGEEVTEKPKGRRTESGGWEVWEIIVLIIGVLVALVLLGCIIYQLALIKRNKGPMVLKIRSKEDKEKSPSSDKKGYKRAPLAEPDQNGMNANGEKKKSPVATPSPKEETTPSPHEEKITVTPSSEKGEKEEECVEMEVQEAKNDEETVDEVAEVTQEDKDKEDEVAVVIEETAEEEGAAAEEEKVSQDASPDIIASTDKTLLIDETAEGNNDHKPPTYFDVSNDEKEKPKEEV